MYGHLLLEVSGIRHPRHARNIEGEFKKIQGIQSVSVSGTGFIQLEYKKDILNRDQVLSLIHKKGLDVIRVEDFHADYEAEIVEEAEDHHHDGIFGERTELIFAIICGIFLVAGFGISFIKGISSNVPIAFYIISYFFGGYYTTKEAVESVLKGKFEIDFLMLVAAIGAAVLGHWAEGALLLFLFSLGHSLEHYALSKAKKSIEALSGLAPKTALLRKGDDLKTVQIESLVPGDIIVVRPNSKIAADGIVVRGSSPVNQAPITGESIPVDKEPVNDKDIPLEQADILDEKYRVFAGTINGDHTLEVKVTKLAADSTISRLIKLVNEAQTQKSPTQHFTAKIEKYYVPAVLILVVLLQFAFVVVDEPFRDSFYRAMAVLVAASPCALAISTPSAVLSGVARGALAGVLFKGGKPLEDLASVNAIAFDKTGTLTEGKPTLTGVYALNGFDERELIKIVVAVEKLSDHPLARAIVAGGIQKLGEDVQPAKSAEGIQGRGLMAVLFGVTVYIGNKELFTEKGDTLTPELISRIEQLEKEGNTTMVVQREDRFIGIVALRDLAREEAKGTIDELKHMGIQKMIMLTGDNQRVGEAVAKEVGISDVIGNLLPEQKVAAIERLHRETGRIAMVGDGVNDAPAMAKSTVGIAMGAAGSDVALETADIALMADKLSNLPFAIGLSKKAKTIIKQNLVISLGMVLFLVPMTISGLAKIGPAVIGHEGSTILVVFNALRLLVYKGPKRKA
ncbi:MAG: cadmium-translocating P-type ATPase [Chitinophagaceae bacterium]|nr:cadmium-translocating P-type ATPase [Chitinophagaceae bacterium]